ncbi:hypothetical protein GPECTOR_1393g606 [Gonium pectorale]|uniref:Uncharacterized protein n=1 Tax=Gonium pectorale TaxID=33097 RepID=A0A150FUQ2_GONPE|nr:hypothetical protein GPECTOR_1393g606 [Gonium pectorale]|eukprot:KXZ40905.1 hypothetical protein GPECTOR_1393g606 [Gonium pectorale]
MRAAVADSDTDTALLPVDIVLRDEDWTGIALPVVIARSLTIRGAAERPVALDLGYLRGKARLANGTTLTLSGVVLANFRSGSAFQAPGLDILLPMLPGGAALVRGVGGAMVVEACFPLDVAM